MLVKWDREKLLMEKQRKENSRDPFPLKSVQHDLEETVKSIETWGTEFHRDQLIFGRFVYIDIGTPRNNYG
jgi:hypothetical protein